MRAERNEEQKKTDFSHMQKGNIFHSNETDEKSG